MRRTTSGWLEICCGRRMMFSRYLAASAFIFSAYSGDSENEVAEATVSEPKFVAEQQSKVREFVIERMSKLSPEDLSELLRSAIKQDEWLLFLHGAVLGSFAGFLHLAIFGV